MSSSYFGQSGFQASSINAPANRYPRYTNTFTGDPSDVNFSGSVYSAYGWDVSINYGTPSTMVATIQCELNGLQPITASGEYITVNWSFHFETTEKDILNAGIQVVPWLVQLNEQQINVLNTAFSNPPTGSLTGSYPYFNSAYNGVAPPVFSSSYGNYTAGDTIWNMGLNGFKTVPIYSPVLRYSAVAGSDFTLTSYTTNVGRFYSATSLASNMDVPANYAALLRQDVDPATTAQFFVPLFYGWMKMPPAMDQNGPTTTIQQEFRYGLYPENIFGTRL